MTRGEERSEQKGREEVKKREEKRREGKKYSITAFITKCEYWTTTILTAL